MKYRFPRVGPLLPSIGVKPSRWSMLPTMQNPVSATVIEATPVAITPRIQSGWTRAASAVHARRTKPAISQTVRSMYHRWVGTM